ncbi:hypothetical protein [Mycobacterium intracellulare]|uniref:hypothetical protein n=1 Tax=Mycobacterium intracellulare TaxID=1767 RepID=UPI00080BFCAA|nr:hypothetical protein [Mycobacterium intracellulare]OCB08090.1 hypothetical protein A5644_08005 [Mycobacterium intracellulare subsp. yongonense]
MTDNHIEASITSFLRALADRLQRNQRADEIQRPRRGDLNDARRYLAELKAVSDDAITDVYQRIDLHGRAVLECSDDQEIAPRVQKMLELAAQEGADMHKLVAGLPLIRDVGSALAVLTVIGIWMVFQG